MLSSPAAAQDATWLATPGSNSLVTGANWSTGTVPTGIGYFGASSITALTVAGAAFNIGAWTFNADAAAYTFTTSESLNFSGAGITVNGGSVGITNNFMLVFQNSASAGAATINNRNTLFFYGASTAGSAVITNVGTYNQFFFFGTSSAGNASITSSNQINFEGNSTAGNASIVNNSYVYFSGNSTAGNSTITNNRNVVFSSFGDGGTAQLINNAANSVIDFSYSTGALGDNKYTIGSLAGMGVVYVGSGRLGIGGNNLSSSFTGVISDCGPSGQSCSNQGVSGGALLKTGTGTLTLAGTNLYTGATVIEGGTLAVNGSIATSSLTTVSAGGTLGGIGTVGNTLIDGGRLAPGNSIGTLNVAGNLAFTSGSIYAVELSPSNADRVNVSGTAALGRATVNASFANGSYINKQYTILNAAGGVSGTFGSQVNTNLPTNFTSNLSYDTNNAYLNLTLNFVPTPTPAPPTPSFGNGLSSNQNAVGNALINSFNSNGGIPLAFGALTPTGLTQVSGETNVGTQQPGFTAATQFVGALSDPTMAGRGANAPSAMGFAEEGDPMNAYAYATNGRKRSGSERDAYAAITKAVPLAQNFVPHWSLWVSGFGGTQTTDGNSAGGTSTSTSRIAGAAVGADYWL
jgi:autotransporter-associated beta strand protein